MRSNLPVLALGAVAAAVAAPVAGATGAALAAPPLTAPMVLPMSFEHLSACGITVAAPVAAKVMAGAGPGDLAARSLWPASPLSMLAVGTTLLGAMWAMPMACARARRPARSATPTETAANVTPLAGDSAIAAEAPACAAQPPKQGEDVLPSPPRRAEPPLPALIRQPDVAPYQNMATDAVLEAAKRLAEDQATPAQILQALQAIGLPVLALPPAVAGVVSVTGNSMKGWNEDTALAFHSNHPVLGPLDVLMVFDGMGGLRDGKLASKFAALAMAIELHRLPDTLTTDSVTHVAAAFERVNRRFRKAGAGLYGRVNGDALRTTAIVLVAEPQRYVVAHQGDGHAMLRRADGSLLPLMQAHKGAASNAVTHSLGPVPDGEARVAAHPRLPGDLVFIASDGFDPVPPDQVLVVLHAYTGQHTLQVVVDGLTDDCCAQRDERGLIADDNMSLAALHSPAEAQPSPAAIDAPPVDADA